MWSTIREVEHSSYDIFRLSRGHYSGPRRWPSSVQYSISKKRMPSAHTSEPCLGRGKTQARGGSEQTRRGIKHAYHQKTICSVYTVYIKWWFKIRTESPQWLSGCLSWDSENLCPARLEPTIVCSPPSPPPLRGALLLEALRGEVARVAGALLVELGDAPEVRHHHTWYVLEGGNNEGEGGWHIGGRRRRKRTPRRRKRRKRRKRRRRRRKRRKKKKEEEEKGKKKNNTNNKNKRTGE